MRSNPSALKILPTALNVGLAILGVSVALAIALVFQRYGFHDVELPLFLLAVAVTSWYGSVESAVLSIVLSATAFNYFFAEPLHTFFFTLEDLPAIVILVAFAVLITWFSTVRRGVEGHLREARDELQVQVIARTRQASLLNLTHDTIIVRDMAFIITYWNRGAQELYGWAPEEAVGQRSDLLLRTNFPIPVDDLRAELLREGRWEGELQRTKADGTEIVVASRWSLRRDERGEADAIMETSNDITEHKRREEEVRALNQELESFAYSVSHDLRAPLRHMVGYAELLQKRAAAAVDDKSRRYLTMILDSAKRMGNLIDDLLAFSRIGRAETQKTTVNLDLLVKEALNDIRQDTNGRDIIWRIGSLPICYGDRSMLRLVLVNLLSNAIKFTRTRPRAEIEIGCTQKNKDEVVVFVKDNGAGFDMKYANKLFGVFQRLHQMDEFEGTGIGLATVQRIIHRHGGKVSAEGAVDQGATFFFSISKPEPKGNV